MSMKINTQMLDLHALLDEHENVFVILNHVFILTLHMKEIRTENLLLLPRETTNATENNQIR